MAKEKREKAHSCNQCDFASADSRDLKRHLQTHSGEKLFKCDQCDIAFARLSNLRAHSKTDSEEKSQNTHHKMNVSQCSLSIIIYSPFSIPVLFFTMTFTNTFRENLKRQYNFAKGF